MIVPTTRTSHGGQCAPWVLATLLHMIFGPWTVPAVAPLRESLVPSHE